ncbi:MAG: nodulation protein NfeD [Actinomycetota bacterium]
MLGALFAAFAVVAAMPGAWASGSSDGRRPVVREIALTGTVDPLIARTVQRGLTRAGTEHADVVLVRIDTPGGLSSSMQGIVKAVAASKVPVVYCVRPVGARAASAGAIILLGCPVAAMAPGTNVGAAHPVGITGEILSEKVTNDAAAYARALAERWGRNAAWAESAVRDSVSVSAGQALKISAIDLIAPTRSALLAAVSGRSVRTALGDAVIPDLSSADVQQVEPTIAERIFHGLIDPNIAFVFFIVGIAGIIFEIIHPGVSVPAIGGLLLLVASLIMFGMLPVNIAGLVLLLASMVFFAVDLHAPGSGVATLLGVVALVLGGLFLFDASVPNARVSRWLIIVSAVAVTAFFSVVAQAVVKARRMPKPASEFPIATGAQGVVVRSCEPDGIVRAGGEQWSAVADGAAIPEGTAVRIVSIEGLKVHVVPLGRETLVEGERS